MGMGSRKLLLFPPVRGGVSETLSSYDGLYFYDDFSNGAVAAGSVDGTASSDTLAKRIVTDTGSKYSVSNKLDSTGNAGVGDPNIRYRYANDAWIAFEDDDAYIFNVKVDGAAYPKGIYEIGYDTNLTDEPQKPKFSGSIANIRVEDWATEIGIANGHAVDLEYDNSVAFNRMVFKAGTDGFVFLKHISGTLWRVEYTSITAHVGVLACPLFYNRSAAGGNEFIGHIGLISAMAMPTAWCGSPVKMANPSALDTATMPSADSFVLFDNVTVPSAGAIQVEFRKSGSDELMVEIDSAGKPTIYENGVEVTAGLDGQVASTEHLNFEFVGATTRMWTHGEQNPTPETPAAVTFTGGTGVNVASLGTGGAIGEIRMWGSYHDAPFVVV